MKCEQMLVRLLDAECDELGGAGNSPAAAHLRECARCRAVANTLLRETAMMAAYLPAVDAMPMRAPLPPRANALTQRFVYVGALAAAAAVALLFAQPRNAAHTAVGIPAVPVRAVRADTPAAAPQKALVAIYATRFPDAVRATPVRFVASQSVEPTMPVADSSGVAVTPPAGTRSAVLATRNPKITVVWLY